MNEGSPFDALPPSSGSVCEAAGGIRELKKGRRIRQTNEALRVDRLPPHAPEMEQGMIGCILLSPNDCLNQIIVKYGSSDEIFYDLRHQAIFSNLVQMWENKKPIDVITLQQRLKDFDLLEQIGGITYLNQLQDCAPSAGNVTYYADIVTEKFILRKIIQACTSIVERVYDYQGDVLTLVDEVERDILKIAPRKQAERAGIAELVRRSMETIERKLANKDGILGLSTGLIDLDRYTDGLSPGELIVPSAFPSVGKTSLLMNMVENIVLVQNRPALVFSLEMTAESLVTRFLCSNSRVNLKRITGGYVVDSDFPRLVSAAGRISKAKLYIIDDLDSISQIRAESRRMRQQFGIEMIGVDYIQRVKGSVSKNSNREQEVASVSSGLKDIATELKIPVVAPSQLNDDGKLRESRAIGQDADQVWELRRQKPTAEDDPESESVDLWIQKNRNGDRGVKVQLTFLKAITRFESAAKVSDEDYEQYADSQSEFPSTPTPNET